MHCHSSQSSYVSPREGHPAYKVAYLKELWKSGRVKRKSEVVVYNVYSTL